MSDNIYRALSDERKKLQEEGKLPKWFTTGGWQLFKAKYAYEEDAFLGRARAIAKTAARHTYAPDVYEGKFFNLIWNGYLSCSTPVLANMGTDRGMPVSCSGTVVDDSIDGFYTNLRENAILSKYGFGTSAYLGNIRGRGSDISVGGKASGVMPVVKNLIQMSRDVTQGSQRRGSIASYLPIDHPDFNELADQLIHDPDDLNVGWCIPNSFIELLDIGDPEAHRRFQRAMKVKMTTGKGYFSFVDKINAKRPKWYVDHDLTVKASNLCVAPETLILTSEGHLPIVSLENQEVEVWNGVEFSKVIVRKTGSDQHLLKVITSDGFELDCTHQHKFYIKNDYHKSPVVVEAKDLKIGDKLIKLETVATEGKNVLDLAYQNGFFTGDGCHVEGNSRVYLYGEKRKLAHLFRQHAYGWVIQENQDREYFYVNGLKSKYFVPDASYSIRSRVEWLAGLLDSDGTVARTGKSQCLQIASTEVGFLEDIQLMLQTLGVQSKVKFTRKAGQYELPANDGTGLNKTYYCKKVNRLLISGMGIVQLKTLGLNTRRLIISDHIPNRNCEAFVKIKEVIDTGRISDTYCFTEPKRGMGVFNGILTGQCDEIVLFSDSEHHFTCVLSSLNLAKWHEWKDTDAAFVATIFLDCVAAEFIEKAKKIHGLEKAVRFTEKSRALGLGVCGFHTLLQQDRLPYEGLQAHMLNNTIFSHIRTKAEEATKHLYFEYTKLGREQPLWLRGYERWNSHLIAIAPTKSTALIMGGVSEGINTDPAMTYTQSSAGGEIERINPTLLALMKEKGVGNKKHIQQVIDNGGSVQYVDWLTNEEKLIFKTGFEIDQRAHLRLAKGRSPHVDQWQSLNFNFSAEEDEEYIAEFHQEAFLDPDILGLYYVYSKAGVRASKDECIACQ